MLPVLYDDVAHLTDCGSTEADQGIGVVIRETLKVAPEATGRRGFGERVVGPGVVVEADCGKTLLLEHLMSQQRLREASMRVRQQRVVDHALARQHPGHVRVAEHRHTGGCKQPRPRKRACDVIQRLAGQSVHEVEIDGGNTGRAQLGRAERHLPERLYSVDLLLDPQGKGLGAEAGPRDTAAGQRAGIIGVETTRIEFRSPFGGRVDPERSLKRRADPTELGCRQGIGAAAAEVDMGDAAADELRYRFNLT